MCSLTDQSYEHAKEKTNSSASPNSSPNFQNVIRYNCNGINSQRLGWPRADSCPSRLSRCWILTFLPRFSFSTNLVWGWSKYAASWCSTYRHMLRKHYINAKPCSECVTLYGKWRIPRTIRRTSTQEIFNETNWIIGYKPTARLREIQMNVPMPTARTQTRISSVE